MSKFIYRHSSGQYKSIGVPEGAFIRVSQGLSLKSRVIVDVDSELYKAEWDSFEVFDEMPEAHWGSGVFRVREDSTLQSIRSNFDSSD